MRNYVRHQFGTGDKLVRNNFFVALKSQFLSVKDDDLRGFILAEYPEFEQALTKPFQGLAKPKDRKGRERMGEDSKGDARGKPESRSELDAYAAEIGMSKADVDCWFDHFEANGWKVGGKAAMKDWRAALRNGQRRAPQFNGTSRNPTASKIMTADTVVDPDEKF